MFFKKIFYLFIFRVRGREGERGRETSMPLTCPLLGTWPATQACAGNRTQRPFGSEAGVQSTEPHQPECKFVC